MTTLREILKARNSKLYSKFLDIENESKKIMSNFRVMFPSYTNHDIIHLQNVENNINQIITKKIAKELSDEEIFCLLSATWLHDVGMIPIESEKEDYENKSKDERELFRTKIREQHHIRSENYIDKHKNELNINEAESKAIGKICKGHRSIDLKNLKDIYSESKIRVNGLAAILRLADECDISKDRESYLSLEGIDKNIKQQHYKIHDIVKNVKFSHDNETIFLVSTIAQESDKEKLIEKKDKISQELTDVQPFLEKIGINLNTIEVQSILTSNLLKKNIILSIAKNDEIEDLIDSFTTLDEIEDELEKLITDYTIYTNPLRLSKDVDKFKEIFKLFLDKKSMKNFFFTEYVQTMIPECFFMIENNFNISLKSKERNLRINLLKNTPTALYFLLFMDTIINNPQFNISSNQNGVLMLDSILSFGLFNDIYHYSSEIDFDEIEESFKNFKIFNKDYVLRMVEGCKSLERDEKYER